VTKAWIALGTGASREVAFFHRVLERQRGQGWPMLCFDTDRAPTALLDERGRADESFIALSGFAPRRWAEERLEADPSSIAWLGKDGFDALPREFLHEAPSSIRVLGRLAYERCRETIKARLAQALDGASHVGIAAFSGGGLSGALPALLADVAKVPNRIIDVVIALPSEKAQALNAAQGYATLKELERMAAIPEEAGLASPIARVHLIRAEVAPYTGVLELVQAIDCFEPPRDASGKIDRESAKGRFYESTRHARELDASGRAPKVFFLHSARELVFPMDMLERTLIARYEREIVAEALAQDPRKTHREGQTLPKNILDDARRAGFTDLQRMFDDLASKGFADRIEPILSKSFDAREVRDGRVESAVEEVKSKLDAWVAEISSGAEPSIDSAMNRVRSALSIGVYARRGISIPTIAESARAAVDQARNLARSLESGTKDHLTSEAFERRTAKLIRAEGPIKAIKESASSLFGSDKRIRAAVDALMSELRELARGRLAGAIDALEARFWRRASISEVRALEASPLEEWSRRVARLRDCHVAAILTQLDYAKMKREQSALEERSAERVFVPDARTLTEIERLAEFKDIFAPMLKEPSAGSATPCFDELIAILDALEKDESLQLDEEASSSDPARFVTALKRAARGRAMRFLASKIEPHLSLYLGRLRPDARAELSRSLAFEPDFGVDGSVLDPALDRPERLAVGGARLSDSPPIEAAGLHGWAGLAWDRVIVDRAMCSLPLFAVSSLKPPADAYRALLAQHPLHVDARLLEEARRGAWSLAATKLETSRALADGAKSLMVEPPRPPQAVLEEKIEARAIPARIDAPDTIPNAPVTEPEGALPHPDAIATFALARALTRALGDHDLLAKRLAASMPVRRDRFRDRDKEGLIEMERVPGEGWHVYAVRVRPLADGEVELGERVALGRYDLASNLLAYSAEPELVRGHRALLETIKERLEQRGELALFDEMRERLAVRIDEQREARAREMKEIERRLYQHVIDVLAVRTEPSERVR
jgi:hypothetical protein